MSLTCPTPDILRKLAFGRVPPDRERELDRHLSACARCRQQHDDHFRPIVAAVRDLSVNRSRGAVATVVADGPPALSATAAESDLGSLGKFRLLEVMGEGGMGRVYRARDTSLNREVALKVILLRGRSAATADQRRGLFAEAQAAAKLDDPNIVPVFEVGEISDTPYLVMPLLKGETLGGCLRRGALPLYEVCRIGSQIARGLSAAHAAGLVHRDIKPGNIWLEPRPSGAAVRVLDFGLAQTLTEATAGLAGTPAYMAPEQAAGRAVDARADLFSLGVVLFEMASGKRLFPGGASSMPELLASVQKFDSPSGVKLLPTVPPRLSGVIAGLLRNDPQRRTPDDAEDLSDTLTALAAEFDPARRRKQLLRFARTAALVVASGLVVLGGVWAKKEFLDAPVNLPRIQRPVDRTAEEPKPVPAARVPQPPRPAIVAGDALANLDHFDRERVPADALRVAGEGLTNGVGPEVVALFGQANGPNDGHSGDICALALHPNGRLLATGGGDKTVRLWDLAEVPPKQTALLTDHDAGLNRLTFTADGKRLVSGAGDGRVVIWTLGTSAPPRRYTMPGAVSGLAAARSRNLVAIGCGDESVRLLDLDTNDDASPLRGSRYAAHALSFAAEDRRLIVGSTGMLKVFDVSAGNADVYSSQEDKVWFYTVAAHPDGNHVLTNGPGAVPGSRPKSLISRLTDDDVKTILSVRSLDKPGESLAVMKHSGRVLRGVFTPEGKRVVSLTDTGLLHLWSWKSETQLAAVPLARETKKDSWLHGLTAHPDGRHALVSLSNGLVYVVRFSETP